MKPQDKKKAAATGALVFFALMVQGPSTGQMPAVELRCSARLVSDPPEAQPPAGKVVDPASTIG